MKTIRECKINMLSVIRELDSCGLTLGEGEKSETELEGFYRYEEENGKRVLSVLTYREVGEGGAVDTELKIGTDSAALKREGAISSLMEFSEGGTARSLYKIPPYSFDMTVKTDRLRIMLDKDGGRVDILYKMTVGGANKAARMKITVTLK